MFVKQKPTPDCIKEQLSVAETISFLFSVLTGPQVAYLQIGKIIYNLGLG